jgi:hypothetical protein
MKLKIVFLLAIGFSSVSAFAFETGNFIGQDSSATCSIGLVQQEEKIVIKSFECRRGANAIRFGGERTYEFGTSVSNYEDRYCGRCQVTTSVNSNSISILTTTKLGTLYDSMLIESYGFDSIRITIINSSTKKDIIEYDVVASKQ